MSGAEPPITEWNPTSIIDEHLLRGKPFRFSLVILNQPIHNIPLFLDLWRRATIRIAADGGANRVYAIRAHLDLADSSIPKLDFIVGDLDSLQDETRAWFLSQWRQQQQGNLTGDPDSDHDHAGADTSASATTSGQIIYIDDQYSADFAKAVKHARELTRLQQRRRQQQRGVPSSQQPREEGEDQNDDEEEGEDIICYSGLGGRVDQAMSQLHHLYMFQQRPRPRPRQQQSQSQSQSSETPDDDDDDDDEGGVEEGEGGEGGYANGRMYLTNGESLTFVLLVGKHRIRIRDSSDTTTTTTTTTHSNTNNNHSHDKNQKPHTLGKHVGIIPLTGPSTLTTKGLEWDVVDWRTAFGERMSTSNHTTPGADVVEVQTSRDVLFTIDVPVLE